jgi:hypothetical protein
MSCSHLLKSVIAIALAATVAPSAAHADITRFKGLYGREHTLPLCDWTTEERSLLQFIDGANETWVCTSVADGQPCTWSVYEPSSARYWFHPRREPRWQGDTSYPWAMDLSWPDGSALYGAWNMTCDLPFHIKGEPAPIPGRHRVVNSTVEGYVVPGTPGCSGTDPSTFVILAEVDAGTVEHIRPGYVRGSVQIARSRYWDPNDDLRVVIQGRVDGQWQDLATTYASTTTAPETYAVEALIPELTDVRLQVRGRIRCNARYGTGYDLRDARIFVETCVPDQSNPGACL